MSKKMIYFGAIIIGIGVICLINNNLSWILGWLYGWLFVYLQHLFRNKYYLEILDLSNFSVTSYIIYLFISIALIVLPLVPIYFVKDKVNMITVVIAYAVDRMLISIEGLLNKKGADDSGISE